MAKVKYIVMGMDDRSLGQLIGLVANGGEVPEGSPELIAAPGNPEAYTIDAAGYLRPADFCKAINAQAQAERAKMKAAKAVQDVEMSQKVAAAINSAAAANKKKDDENPTAAA